MSKTNTLGLATAQWPAMAPASRPQDNIFRSFNALNPKVFEDPLSYLRTVTGGDISAHVTVADDANRFYSQYKEHTFSQENRQEFSSSIGLKGRYGVFSASANRTTETVQASSSTALYATYVARLNLGVVSINAMPAAAMLSLLRPEMVNQLRAITSLADARDFTNTWGTHLITRVRTGGKLFISIEAQTSSSQFRQTIASEIKAKYDSVDSMEMAINVRNEISSSENTKDVSQTMKALGGNSNRAAAMNPENSASVTAWLTSVTTDTTFAVLDSIEIYTLVDGLASTMLKKYLDLSMLAFSLENPTIFATGRDIRSNNTTSVLATATSGFKVIGGGATVTLNSNNFLMGSFPQANNGRPPVAWAAVSRDLIIPAVQNDVLTSYAIAIHDPEDYIEVTVAEGKGSKKGTGADTAKAVLEDGWILTCGGVNSRTVGGFNKFVTASYFEDEQTWCAASSDYKHPASEVELTAYAVGIRSLDPQLIIEVDMQVGAEERGQHGRPTAIASGQVCGGGVCVSDNSGPGNLVQMCWPQETRMWKATNKDLDSSVSVASSQAYALSLHAGIEM